MSYTSYQDPEAEVPAEEMAEEPVVEEGEAPAAV